VTNDLLARGRGRDSVVLVHGIKSRGAWYRYFERVLEPHFRCERADYDEYHQPILAALLVYVSEASAVRMVMPVLLLAALVAIVAGIRVGAMSFAALIAASAVARIVVIQRCRERALEKVGDAIKRSGAVEPGPSMVAHSFGSFLVGQLIQRANQRVNRLVLTGAVLPENFDWRAIQERGIVRETWNAVCQGDTVARVAGWAGGNLGASGRRGFRANRDTVHSVSRDQASCAQCAETGRDASASRPLVHNLVAQHCEHTDFALSSAFALDHLLPVLLGYSSGEYRKLRQIAVALVRNEERRPHSELLVRAAAVAADISSDWLGGATLLTKIDELDLDEAPAQTALRFFEKVDEGVRALEDHLRADAPLSSDLRAKTQLLDYRHAYALLAT